MAFRAPLSYRRPRFGLLDDILEVVCGNNISFAEYQKTLRLALPSWFRKLSIETGGGGREVMKDQSSAILLLLPSV